MLAGGIGNGAINNLKARGVDVVRNCEGDVTEIVIKYLAGEVKDGGSNCSAHEDGHEDGHVCSHN